MIPRSQHRLQLLQFLWFGSTMVFLVSGLPDGIVLRLAVIALQFGALTAWLLATYRVGKRGSASVLRSVKKRVPSVAVRPVQTFAPAAEGELLAALAASGVTPIVVDGASIDSLAAFVAAAERTVALPPVPREPLARLHHLVATIDQTERPFALVVRDAQRFAVTAWETFATVMAAFGARAEAQSAPAVLVFLGGPPPSAAPGEADAGAREVAVGSGGDAWWVRKPGELA